MRIPAKNGSGLEGRLEWAEIRRQVSACRLLREYIAAATSSEACAYTSLKFRAWIRWDSTRWRLLCGKACESLADSGKSIGKNF
jgi:hypothetical protein